MATLGKPAVNDPREFTLREVQLVVANIRQRLGLLDSTVGTLQATTAQSQFTASADLRDLKTQLANLQAELNALAEIVAGLEGGGASDTDPRTEQLAGELMELQREVGQLGSPDPGRLPQVEAQLAGLQQQVDGIDTIGQTSVHAAMLQRLQRQVEDLNCGVLI